MSNSILADYPILMKNWHNKYLRYNKKLFVKKKAGVNEASSASK